MSTEHSGSSAPQCGYESPSPQQPPCCCCAHKKSLIALLVMVILAAGGVWLVMQQLGGSERGTEPYRVAMEKIRANTEIRDKLGVPITDAWRAGGTIEDQRPLLFDIAGPKGKAKVELRARCMQGKWELNILEVKVDGSHKKLNLLQDEGGAPPFTPSQGPGGDAPAFQAAPAAKTPEATAASEDTAGPQINLPLPGNSPGVPPEINLPAPADGPHKPQ
jgi:hypothetical protein